MRGNCRSFGARLLLFYPPGFYFLLSSHVFSAFLIKRSDKYWCAQGLCYDIFIVCVHVGDVDVNTAFYRAPRCSDSQLVSRLSKFI